MNGTSCSIRFAGLFAVGLWLTGTLGGAPAGEARLFHSQDAAAHAHSSSYTRADSSVLEARPELREGSHLEEATAVSWDSQVRLETLPEKPAVEPQRVVIQRIVLSFDGSVPNRKHHRLKAQADSLAHAILFLARRGADFDSLVKAHSDEIHPTIYKLTNTGVRPSKGERTRKAVEPAVGDAAFGIRPGNIQIVEPDGRRCRYGWYIIKRLK